MDSVFDLFKNLVKLFISVFVFLPSWARVFVGGVAVLIIVLLALRIVRG